MKKKITTLIFTFSCTQHSDQEGNTEERNGYVDLISTDQLDSGSGWGGGGVTPPAPTTFYSRLLDR
jgi:hypothetical protein